jgi:hypothetical protein
VVSEEIYWGLVKHEYEGIRQDTFRLEVRVDVGGRRRQGWVHVPEERAMAVPQDGSHPSAA